MYDTPTQLGVGSISVIVPLYNKERTIERALNSICSQTMLPAEIIVVDDCSTDSSCDVVETFSESSNVEVRLIRQDHNRGPGAARNKGVSKATQPWVAFLDADDYWHPDFLQEVWRAVTENEASFGSSGRIVKDPKRGPREFLFDDHEAEFADRLFWYMAVRVYPIHSSSALAMRDELVGIGGFPEDVRHFEDVIVWARLWQQGKFAFVNRPLSIYDRIESGITTKRPPISAAALFLVRLAVVALRSVKSLRAGSSWAIFFVFYLCWDFSRSVVVHFLKSRIGMRLKNESF